METISGHLPRRHLLAGLTLATVAAPTAGLARTAGADRGVVVLIASNDPAVMGHAVGYAGNLSRHFADQKIKMPIEVVANGKGIDVFRADRTPLREPLLVLRQQFPHITYSVCQASKTIAEEREQMVISIIDGVRLVPYGVGRVADLQLQGWACIHG